MELINIQVLGRSLSNKCITELEINVKHCSFHTSYYLCLFAKLNLILTSRYIFLHKIMFGKPNLNGFG